MARKGGRAGYSHTTRRPVDLTGAISITEKNDLVALVNAITERLYNEICSIFDSPPVTPVSGEHGHHHWLSLPLLHHREDKNLVVSSPQTIQPEGDRSSSYREPHNITENVEDKESMTPQLCELKKEAVTFFRKWQTIVLQRIRDTNVDDTQAAQGGGRGLGRAIRSGVRGRGGRGGRSCRGGLTLATGPPRVPSKHADLALAQRYPPIPNTLWTLPHERRRLFLHIVFLVALSMSEYTANSYLLLVNLTSSLNLPRKAFQAEETKMAVALAKAALDVSPEELLSQTAEDIKAARKWKGHVPWVNSNLAPALVTFGIGTSQGSFGLTGCAAAGLLGPMADHGRSMCNFFGMNPAKPTGKMLEVFAREIQDFAFLPIHGEIRSEYNDARESPAEDRRLRLLIAMGGWATEDEDVRKPWLCLGQQLEAYALRWEPDVLLNLGTSLETVIKSTAWSSAKREINARTIFACLIDSVWPVSLLKISKIMDNPWSVGMVRAEKAGGVLADAIMRHKFQGDRPVSLVGYGLAARSIYACLMALAERRQFGQVESVVMMGAPVPSESRVWLTLKSVVSGRLINVYSEHDYLLGFLCRFSNTQFGIAGLQDIQGADGVENYRVGELPREHLSYQAATGRILKAIGWEDLDKGAIQNGRPRKKRAALRRKK